VSRISAFYSMDYPAVLKLPLKVFWAFNRNIDRLRAESDQRLLRLMAASNDGEAAKNHLDRLAGELGKPVVIEKVFDANQFEKI